MKFSQLIEYNMKNLFLKKSCANCGGETIPTPFSKKTKLSISLDQQYKVLYSLLLLYVQGLFNYIESKLQTICF